MSQKSILIQLCIFISILGCGTDTATKSKNNEKSVKRIGMVIKLKPEYVNQYKALHSKENPGVRDLLTKYGMRNFSIFLHEIEPGEFYEFGYYEYVGSNFEEDMQALAKEDRNIEWLKICDPMQIPLEGSTSWTEMEQVYFNQ